MQENFKDMIEKADMVLVGLGEEFNDISSLKNLPEYEAGKQMLEESGKLWLLPAYYQQCRKKLPERQTHIKEALYKLAELLQGKNYFIVSTSVNSMIAEAPWKDRRLVMPCGGTVKKQCSEGCQDTLEEITEADAEKIASYIEGLVEKRQAVKAESKDTGGEVPNLGVCPHCGKPYILNNIYAQNYNENGYLSQWQLYTKWLQGTLNRNVVILELGVGMQFPSVIRWPFEKIAFFNQKASFYRVNKTLYQMSEELKDKGISISENSIDWLRGM